MKRLRNRRKEGYNGSAITSWMMEEIVTGVMDKILQQAEVRPDLILAAWPEVVGAQIATMTQAASYENGILLVKVKTSTLMPLLREAKGKIITSLRSKFPGVEFENILFRMG